MKFSKQILCTTKKTWSSFLKVGEWELSPMLNVFKHDIKEKLYVPMENCKNFKYFLLKTIKKFISLCDVISYLFLYFIKLWNNTILVSKENLYHQQAIWERWSNKRERYERDFPELLRNKMNLVGLRNSWFIVEICYRAFVAIYKSLTNKSRSEHGDISTKNIVFKSQNYFYYMFVFSFLSDVNHQVHLCSFKLPEILIHVLYI